MCSRARTRCAIDEWSKSERARERERQLPRTRGRDTHERTDGRTDGWTQTRAEKDVACACYEYLCIGETDGGSSQFLGKVHKLAAAAHARDYREGIRYGNLSFYLASRAQLVRNYAIPHLSLSLFISFSLSLSHARRSADLKTRFPAAVKHCTAAAADDDDGTMRLARRLKLNAKFASERASAGTAESFFC